MPETAKLSETVGINIDGTNHEFPVITGTYNEKGIDISKFRGQTKYVTLDTGYKNTGATKSSITYIDGENGVLLHRGYPIEQLAEHAEFLEICYLLFKGELPNSSELDDFKAQVKAHMGLPDNVKHILNALPDETHPMGMLSVLLNSLSGFFPDSLDSWTDESVRWASIYRLLANMPVLAAYIYRRQKKLDYIDPDPNLGYVANFFT